MKPGRFITLEGGEGTGKSTLIAGLSAALRERNIGCMVTREPGGTPLAESVREIALHPPKGHSWSPLAQALLMNAAREDHLERQIRPALRKGHWVFCDRFADSTRAYQSIDGAPMSVLMAFEAAVVGDTRPDLTLILDAPPEQIAQRRLTRGTSDAFEAKDIGFHVAVRAAFLTIAKDEPDRCVVIDALQAPDAVLAAALATISERVGMT